MSSNRRLRTCGATLTAMGLVVWSATATAGATDPEKPATAARRSYNFVSPRPGEMRDNPVTRSGTPPSLAQFTPATQDDTIPENGVPIHNGTSSASGIVSSASRIEVPPTQARLAERIAQAGIMAAVADPPVDAAAGKVLVMLGQSLSLLPAAAPLPSSKALYTLTAILGTPLGCRFQAVGVGQFNGLDYGPGVPSGTSAVIVAASGDDLRQGRAALLDQNTAAAARLRLTDKQALFVEADPGGDIATLTLFTAAGSAGGYPAVLARQSIFGRVPVLVQSTGTCRASVVPR